MGFRTKWNLCECCGRVKRVLHVGKGLFLMSQLKSENLSEIQPTNVGMGYKSKNRRQFSIKVNIQK